MVATNPGMADDSERGNSGKGCDVTQKEKEELQDLNNKMDTFMMEVKEKFRSLQEELEEVAKKKEDYYEGRQRMEEEYKQSRERELILARQSRDDFEGWWECAKETLKETEVGIQKRMEEIPEVKRETCESFIQNRTLVGEKGSEGSLGSIEEEDYFVCSQCITFQQERDDITKKFDESRREKEVLKHKLRHTKNVYEDEKRKLSTRISEIEESHRDSTVSGGPVVLSGINLTADIEKYRKLIDETKSFVEK